MKDLLLFVSQIARSVYSQISVVLFFVTLIATYFVPNFSLPPEVFGGILILGFAVASFDIFRKQQGQLNPEMDFTLNFGPCAVINVKWFDGVGRLITGECEFVAEFEVRNLRPLETELLFEFQSINTDIIVSNLAQKDYKLDVRITGSGTKQGTNRVRLLSGGSASGQLRIYPKLDFDEIEKGLRAIAHSKRFDVLVNVVQIDAGAKEYVVSVADPSEVFGCPILKSIENRVNASPQYSNNPLSGGEVIDYVRWLTEK